MTRRAFTVQEANALIPHLEGVLQRIDERRAEIQRRHDQMQVLDLLWGSRILEAGNPDHAEAVAHRTALLNAAREIQRMVDLEVLGRGVRFPQGGMEHGLLDFPTTWEGRWVYLCWRRGESAVTAWHEIQAGFAGRQPITPAQELRMGREDDPAQLDDSGLDF